MKVEGGIGSKGNSDGRGNDGDDTTTAAAATVMVMTTAMMPSMMKMMAMTIMTQQWRQ